MEIMKEELQNKFKSIQKDLVDHANVSFDLLLKGEISNFETLLSPGDITHLLGERGWDTNDDFDSNGWQWDFWFTMSKDNATVSISGCGYYGGLKVSNNA